MADESNDQKECIVIKDDDIELVLIKNSSISMNDAIRLAIEKLREA